MIDARQRFEVLLDRIVYVIHFASDLPEFDTHGLQGHLIEVINEVDAIDSLLVPDAGDEPHWISLAKGEATKAKRLYESGDFDGGRVHLEACREFVASAMENTSMKPTFIVDPSGKASRVP